MQKHIARRTSWHQRITSLVCFEILCDLRYLLIEIIGIACIYFDLTVIGSDHQQSLCRFSSNILVKGLLYQSEETLNDFLGLPRGGAMVMTSRIKAIKIEEVIGWRGSSGSD